jgi:Ni/Co efflux regulator RcnB
MLAATLFFTKGYVMTMLSATTVAAMALGLALSGTVAHAADYPGRGNQDATTQQQDDKNDKGDKKDRRAKPPVQAAPAAVPRTQHNNRNRARDAKLRRGHNEQANDGLRTDNRNDWRDGNRPNNPNWNRNNRRNVDIRRWQRNFNAPRRFRIDAYNAPRGYSYRRWGYGQRLPRDYYARNFWLTQFLMFGLETPPYGYVWVRYGPDALLVDRETGEIVQVQYNVFYS